MRHMLRSAIFCLALVAAAGLGCHHKCRLCHKNDNCGGCPDGSCGGCKSGGCGKDGKSMTMSADQAADASATATYPYYSMRGPRDYLQP